MLTASPCREQCCADWLTEMSSAVRRTVSSDTAELQSLSCNPGDFWYISDLGQISVSVYVIPGGALDGWPLLHSDKQWKVSFQLQESLLTPLLSQFFCNCKTTSATSAACVNNDIANYLTQTCLCATGLWKRTESSRKLILKRQKTEKSDGRQHFLCPTVTNVKQTYKISQTLNTRSLRTIGTPMAWCSFIFELLHVTRTRPGLKTGFRIKGTLWSLHLLFLKKTHFVM